MDKSTLDAQSYPTVQSALYSYTHHPEVATLNQIMLPYLGIEEILILYHYNYEHTVGRWFETRQTLNTLSLRFQLPTATTFKQLLRAYDMQYATVRSYLYNNRSPKEVLFQAALEGDIQAMYNQLKLYPELRDVDLYSKILYKAAEGGHRAIIYLLLELGATYTDSIIIGAAAGGHLSLAIEYINYLGEAIEITTLLSASFLAAVKGQMEVLAYILSIDTSLDTLNHALEGAGESGNSKTIEYLIAKGADNYLMLVEAASEKGHLEIVEKYCLKVEPSKFYYILKYAVEGQRFDIVKCLFEKGVVDTDTSCRILTKLKSYYTHYDSQLEVPTKKAELLALIEYLELQGVVCNF